MSYEIQINRREEKTNGETVRDDIVLSKVTTYDSIGGLKNTYSDGSISFPYKDLPALIEDLQEHLTPPTK